MNRLETFPHAPVEWSVETALETARKEGIDLEKDHWAVIFALQEFFAHYDNPSRMNRRALHDALNEKFYYKGGLKYLYRLLPGGPIAQGCRLAGLEAPAGSVDQSYGSTS